MITTRDPVPEPPTMEHENKPEAEAEPTAEEKGEEFRAQMRAEVHQQAIVEPENHNNEEDDTMADNGQTYVSHPTMTPWGGVTGPTVVGGGGDNGNSFVLASLIHSNQTAFGNQLAQKSSADAEARIQQDLMRNQSDTLKEIAALREQVKEEAGKTREVIKDIECSRLKDELAKKAEEVVALKIAASVNVK